MNDNKSELYQKCLNPDCAFEGNSPNATLCQVCGTPLNEHYVPCDTQTKEATRKTKKKDWSKTFLKKINHNFDFVVICGLLVIVPISYLYSVRDKPSSTVIPPESVSPSQSTDIKIYPTIKEVAEVPAGIFTYGGSICFAALAREGLNEAIALSHSEFQLRYVEPKNSPGCTGGVEMLLTQDLSFAQNALPITTEELKEANRKGKELESIPVAKDGIVFYINKTNRIKSLSLEEVRDIYLGKITNWREVGGANLPINVVSLDPETNQDLQPVMGEDGVHLPKKVKIVRDYTSAIRQVASTPGAISYASSAIMLGQSSIRPIALSKNSETVPFSALKDDGTVNLQAFERNNYPITRQLYVVIRRDGTNNEKAGVAYANFLVSTEGQAMVRKAGFVPIYQAPFGKLK